MESKRPSWKRSGVLGYLAVVALLLGLMFPLVLPTRSNDSGTKEKEKVTTDGPSKRGEAWGPVGAAVPPTPGPALAPWEPTPTKRARSSQRLRP